MSGRQSKAMRRWVRFMWDRYLRPSRMHTKTPVPPPSSKAGQRRLWNQMPMAVRRMYLKPPLV